MNESSNSKLISAVVILVLIGIAAAVFNQRESKTALTAQSRKTSAKDSASEVKIHPAQKAPFDFAAALNETLAERNPQTRSIAFGKLFSSWLEVDAEGALAYVKNLPQGSQYDEGFFMVIGHIATNDSTRAILLAGEMAKTSNQKQIFNSLFNTLAVQNLTNALNAIALVPTGEDRENALSAIASYWSTNDMNATLTWAKTLNDPAERSVALEVTLTELAGQNPKKAFQLAMESLEGDALENVAAAGLTGMLQTDPSSVSQLIAQLPAGDLQTGLAMDVARALTAQQPEIAMAWVQTLPAGELRQAALNNVLDVWNSQSPADVAQFILQMPAGEDQDAAVTHMSHSFGAANPEDAMRWAQGLPSDSAKNSAVVNIVSGWAENDPVAATVWAQNLPADSPLRLQALRGAFSYWTLSDAASANTFSNSLSKADQAVLFGNSK